VRAEHHDVFGSHSDEGRIYRILDMLDGDLIWGGSPGAQHPAKDQRGF
jgi:hypothetical protein